MSEYSRQRERQEVADWLNGIADEIETDPSRWAKYVIAKDADGCSVPVCDKGAIAWCARGFVHRDWGAFSITMLVDSNRALLAAIPERVERSIAYYNDMPDTTVAVVVAWFRRAAGVALGRDGG